jgi:nicotinate-nucleotide adenylyltransferase
MGRLIGVFGGTFDPPHHGHLILAAEAHAQLKLDKILWVLTAGPPHKQGQAVTPLALRWEMLCAAIGENPNFLLSRVDIDRPPPHYALDTMRILSTQQPDDDFIYLMGGDSLRDLPTWHQPAQFIELCAGIAVMRRFEEEIDFGLLERLQPNVREKVHFIDAPLIEISSTEIRTRIHEGRPYQYYLPSPVFEIIQAGGLYR